MGEPAARLGDTAKTCNDPTDMPTGTVIGTAATVLINNMPAAKKNDQVVGVDVHIVMVPSPGGPVPTPLPHPYTGMIDNNVSSSVKIMGQPAAYKGSTATNTPSHIPTPPGTAFQNPPSNKAEIIIGSINVLIGNGGGGSGSGSGGGDKSTAALDKPDGTEGHKLDVKFVDKGGKSIGGAKYKIKDPDGKETEGTLTGHIKQGGVKEGSHEIKIRAIKEVSWSVKKAKVGDEIKLKAKLAGVESGCKAEFHIFRKDIGSADDAYALLEADVDGDDIEVQWDFEYREEEGEPGVGKTKSSKYSNPCFYFVLKVDGMQARSDFLRITDDLELELTDENGDAIKEEEYEVRLATGEVKKGKLDKDGKATIKNVPVQKNQVDFPKQAKAKKLPE